MNIEFKLLATIFVFAIGCSPNEPNKQSPSARDENLVKPKIETSALGGAKAARINSQQEFEDAQKSFEEYRRDAKPTFPKIDIERGEVRIEAIICLADGILEFLTVSRGGRHYEAILNTECLPSNLHAALLMIGVEPFEEKLGVIDGKQNPFITPEQLTEWNSDALKSKGRLKIEIEYEEDGKLKRVDAHTFIKSGEQEVTRPQDAWVFTGSQFVEQGGQEIYLADTIDVVISIIHEPAAIIQFASNVGNPYENDKMGFAVMPLPREMLGKKAELIFSPWRK